MKINIDIDDNLMDSAQKLINAKTKKAVVEEALKLYVVIGNQRRLKELWGKIKWDDKAVLL